MKKLFLAFFLSLFCMGVTGTAFAGSPCGAELCLSDYEEATKMGAGCKQEIDDFFAIKAKHDGDFSKSRTYKKRRDYLYKCDSGNTEAKERILALYGRLEDAP